MKTSNRRKLAAVVLPFALLVAACGSDSGGSDGAAPASGSDTTVATTVAPGGTDTTAAPGGGTEGPAPEGEACSQVPADGPGSVQGMAQDPVGTAASNNPLLKTLVAAVTEAGLVDTLNGPGPFTVFAPIDSAFEKIPKDKLDALLADKDMLTKVLTHHVIPERLEIGDIKGEHKTVNGDTITIAGDSPAFTVDDGTANVVCAGVQTANATVYLIDSVLMPTAS